jgi:hypothetical protein
VKRGTQRAWCCCLCEGGFEYHVGILDCCKHLLPYLCASLQVQTAPGEMLSACCFLLCSWPSPVFFSWAFYDDESTSAPASATSLLDYKYKPDRAGAKVPACAHSSNIKLLIPRIHDCAILVHVRQVTCRCVVLLQTVHEPVCSWPKCVRVWTLLSCILIDRLIDMNQCRSFGPAPLPATAASVLMS